MILEQIEVSSLQCRQAARSLIRDTIAALWRRRTVCGAALLNDVTASPASRRLASDPPALANHPRFKLDLTLAVNYGGC